MSVCALTYPFPHGELGLADKPHLAFLREPYTRYHPRSTADVIVVVVTATHGQSDNKLRLSYCHLLIQIYKLHSKVTEHRRYTVRYTGSVTHNNIIIMIQSSLSSATTNSR